MGANHEKRILYNTCVSIAYAPVICRFPGAGRPFRATHDGWTADDVRAAHDGSWHDEQHGDDVRNDVRHASDDDKETHDPGSTETDAENDAPDGWYHAGDGYA